MDQADVEQRFSETKRVFLQVIEAVKEGQEKPIIEPLSKEMVKNLYEIKCFLIEVDSSRSKALLIKQEISELEKKISEQDKLFEELQKFTDN